MAVFKNKKIKFSQENYDNLFHCIENDLRELGFGDVSVNKKMKDLNKLLYDILLKINNKSDDGFELNTKLILKYFDYLKDEKNPKMIGAESAKRIKSDGLKRTICDYISGMTDRYVLEEYNRLKEMKFT